MKKKLMIVLFFIISLFCATSLTAMAVGGTNLALDNTSCYMVGASIRYGKGAGGDIRFEFHIEKAKYDSLATPLISVLITPSGLPEKEIAVDALTYLFDYNLDGKDMKVGRVYIYNVPQDRYAKDFTIKLKIASASLVNGTYITEPITRSISYVANCALNDKTAIKTAEQTLQLKNSIPASVVRSFDAPTDADYVRWWQNTAETKECLKEFNGEKGVLHIRHSNGDWPSMTFKPVHDMSKYQDYNYLIIRAFIPNDANALKYLRLGLGAGQGEIDTIIYDKWHDYVFNIAPFLEHWQDWLDLAEPGSAKLWFQSISATAAGDVYISDISVAKKTNLLSVKADEVLSFDNKGDIANFKWLTSEEGNRTTAITQIDSFSGENGVLRIEHGGNDWPAITFTPIQEMSKYNGYDYFVVRAYIPSAGNALKYMFLTNQKNADTEGIDSNNKIYYDAWHDYVFKIAPFIQEWSKPTIDTFKARLSFESLNKGVGNIYIADMSVAKKADDITIPEQNVNTQVSLPSAKIAGVEVSSEITYMINGVITAVTNNTFTPTERGNVMVHYKAVKDNIVYHTWSNIKVNKADIRKDEILSFSDKNDINNIKWLTSPTATQTITHLDSFSGENGVLRIEHGGNDWPAITFTPIQEMSKYNGYDYFVVRAYIPSAGNALKYMFLTNQKNADTEGIDSNNKIYYDAWHDYVFKIAPFIQEWSKPTIDTFKARLSFESLNKDVGNIYIADMSVAKKADDITIPEQNVNTQVSLPSAKIAGVEVSSEITYMINGVITAVTNNTFTPTVSGNVMVHYKAVKDNIVYHTWSNIKVNKADIRKDEILSFSDRGDINNIKWLTSPTATQTITHLDSFSGENGVARIEHSGNDWPAMSFTPIQEMSKYNGYDYFVVRAYIPSAGNALKYMNLGNNTGCDSWGKDSYQKIYYDTWHDYVFDIAPFIQEWSKPIIDVGPARIWFETLNKGVGNIYIADMSVAKKADDITILEQNVNTQVSLPSARIAGVEVSSEITYMINGVITAVTNNTFTPTVSGTCIVHYKAFKDNIAYHYFLVFNIK